MVHNVKCPICGVEKQVLRTRSAPPTYCGRKCSGFARRGKPSPRVVEYMRQRVGPKHPRWKGGRFIDDKGYVMIRVGGKKKYEREHRIVMAGILGRALESHEIIHHKNHDRTDNRPENLELTDRSRHVREHHLDGPQFQPINRWSRGYDACVHCGTTTARYGARGRCKSCYAHWLRERPTP